MGVLLNKDYYYMGDRAEVKLYITNESPKPVKEY